MNKLPTILHTFSTLMLTLIVTIGFSQPKGEIPFDDLPPNPEYGKCYAKCKMPDRYETSSVQKLVKEASSRYETIPAVYKTVQEQVLVKEGYTRMVPVDAVYETVTERVMVKEAATRIENVPAVYTTQKERSMVEESQGQWVRKKKDENCFSDNPEDCYILCWEEKPAVYKTTERRVLATAASTRTINIPAEYKTMTKRVLKTPATVREVQVPAVYKTVSKRVLVTPAQQREINIPAEYTTYNERKLVAKGGYTAWTEILCASKTTSSTVQQVQRALVREGYNPGPIDGVLGVKTQTALKTYQKAEGLPIGNLNLQTLKSLGLN